MSKYFSGFFDGIINFAKGLAFEFYITNLLIEIKKSTQMPLQSFVTLNRAWSNEIELSPTHPVAYHTAYHILEL